MAALILVAGSFLLACGLYGLTEGMKKRRLPGLTLSIGKSRRAISSPGELTDYDTYVFETREKLLYWFLAGAALFIVAYIFYQSLFLSVLAAPWGYFYLGYKKNQVIRKRKNLLNAQFREMLYALSSSLYAGKSVEIAFQEAKNDLEIISGGQRTYIISELVYIIRRLEMNEPLEEALADFARRSHLADVDSFVEVFNTCKRTGGNLIEIIKNTSQIIGEKSLIQQEIETSLAQRKFEQKVLNIMPVALILFLTWSTGSYMTPVFTTLAGRVVMTLALCLFVLAAVLSQKIMDIEV